jgi:hypothetical protein
MMSQPELNRNRRICLRAFDRSGPNCRQLDRPGPGDFEMYDVIGDGPRQARAILLALSKQALDYTLYALVRIHSLQS